MRLVLVRHGEYASPNISTEMGLTEKGVRDAVKVAGFFLRSEVKVDRIWHSGKLRAVQTAVKISETMGFNGACEMCDGLNPNDPVEGVAEKIREFSLRSDGLIIVGHLPSLANLAGFLLTGSEPAEAIEFQPCGAICLEESKPGKWRLQWQISPALIS